MSIYSVDLKSFEERAKGIPCSFGKRLHSVESGEIELPLMNEIYAGLAQSKLSSGEFPLPTQNEFVKGFYDKCLACGTFAKVLQTERRVNPNFLAMDARNGLVARGKAVYVGFVREHLLGIGLAKAFGSNVIHGTKLDTDGKIDFIVMSRDRLHGISIRTISSQKDWQKEKCEKRNQLSEAKTIPVFDVPIQGVPFILSKEQEAEYGEKLKHIVTVGDIYFPDHEYFIPRIDEALHKEGLLKTNMLPEQASLISSLKTLI